MHALVPAQVDVKAIRTRLGLTQQTFAARFGFNINTLRHWEQGRRAPEGPTRAYLLLIDREPDAVLKARRIACAASFAGVSTRVNDCIFTRIRNRIAAILFHLWTSPHSTRTSVCPACLPLTSTAD